MLRTESACSNEQSIADASQLFGQVSFSGSKPGWENFVDSEEILAKDRQALPARAAPPPENGTFPSPGACRAAGACRLGLNHFQNALRSMFIIVSTIVSFAIEFQI